MRESHQAANLTKEMWSDESRTGCLCFWEGAESSRELDKVQCFFRSSCGVELSRVRIVGFQVLSSEIGRVL